MAFSSGVSAANSLSVGICVPQGITTLPVSVAEVD
ncbi:Uncharacterised protein [Vibrio cholerae]|nr:Uncharacterised protein [Vibrio cholerae]